MLIFLLQNELAYPFDFLPLLIYDDKMFICVFLFQLLLKTLRWHSIHPVSKDINSTNQQTADVSDSKLFLCFIIFFQTIKTTFGFFIKIPGFLIWWVYTEHLKCNSTVAVGSLCGSYCTSGCESLVWGPQVKRLGQVKGSRCVLYLGLRVTVGFVPQGCELQRGSYIVLGSRCVLYLGFYSKVHTSDCESWDGYYPGVEVTV